MGSVGGLRGFGVRRLSDEGLRTVSQTTGDLIALANLSPHRDITYRKRTGLAKGGLDVFP
jgi:hypothetical protein